MKFEYIQVTDCSSHDIDRIASEGYRLAHLIQSNVGRLYVFEKMIITKSNE